MEWVKCSDGFPKEGENVLTFMNGEKISVDYIVDCGDFQLWACILMDEQNKVTHWMPLPSAPREEG